MDTTQLYVGQSLRRVQQFLTARADAVGSAKSNEARRQLDTALAAFDAATAEQATIRREIRSTMGRIKDQETTLVQKYVTPLTKYARAFLTGVPEYAALTPSTGSLRRDRLITAARSMSTAAEKHSTVIAREFHPQFLQELRTLTDVLQKSIEDGLTRRTSLTGSARRIDSVLAQGRRAVVALDGVVTNRIRGDDRLEREWRSAKRVQRVGVSVEEPIVGSATTPVSSKTPEVKAA